MKRYLLPLLALCVCLSATAASGWAWDWPSADWLPWSSRPQAPATQTVSPKAVKPAKPAKVPIAKPYALIETSRGTMAMELYPKEAPKTVANFIKLVERGFYNQNGMVFHRVVPGFVVQTGDPTGTGEGGSEERIPLEIQNKLSHDAKGIVAMARTAAPNSATSQFYITLTSQRQLDGKYAIFGRVIRGLPVLSQIYQGDALYGIRLVSESELPPEDPKSIMGIKVR